MAQASVAQARPAGAHFLFAGLFLVSVAAVLVIKAMSANSVDDQIRWGAIALAAFCTGLLPLMSVAAKHDGLGLASWRIGPWSLVWGALAFGLATISWLSPQTQGGPSGAIVGGSILRALWMIAVALTMLAVGYCAGPYRLAAHRARRATERLNRRCTDQIRGPLVPWVLLGVGLIAQFGFAVLTGHFGYVGNVEASVSTASGYSQYLAVAGECVPLAVVAAAIRAYRTRTIWAWLTLLVLFAAAIAAGAVAGGKESFVVAILAVIIPHSVVRRRLPTGAIVAAVLFFLLIAPAVDLIPRILWPGKPILTPGY